LPDQTLDRILQELERDGFSLSSSLLSVHEIEEIEAFFNSKIDSFSAAKIGPKENKQRMESVRGDHTLWIDSLSPPRALGPVVDFLEALKREVNQKFFLGLQQFECHLAFYPKGTFYTTHYDTFDSDSSRRLSFVFYLNSSWEDSWGGELVLYDKEGKELKKVFPRPGSFICFLSSDFPHEVRPATRERRSFTGWMHRKIIY
jgi:SM-20-related protein